MKTNNLIGLSLVILSMSTFASDNVTKLTKYAANKAPDFLRQANDQIGEHICGIEENEQDWSVLQKELKQQLHRQQIKNNYLQKHRKNSKKNQTAATQNNVIENGNGIDGRYYIPVAFHVYGPDYNCEDESELCLTDEKILDALNKTNEDFQGLNTLDDPIAEQFQAIRANLDIEFVLAKKKTNGEPTNGIIRYEEEKKGYGDRDADEQVAADAWDNYKYLNVYIMTDLYDSGKLNSSGVAWYPQVSMSNAGTARVVYNGKYLGTNTNENFRSVLTHEFGHWLNLIHTFEDNSCSISTVSFCELNGDNTCDTPQMENQYLRNNELNCVGEPTNTENFMHYTNNYAMFTKLQVERMTAALHGDARRSIWSNSNLIDTGLSSLTNTIQPTWNGTGLDRNFDPSTGDIIYQQSELSAEKGAIDTFKIDVPKGTTAMAFYLDGFTEDPDLYVSKSVIPTPPTEENENWVADFISFRSTGKPELILETIGANSDSYYVSIHAYKAYSNATLSVLSMNDKTLCEGCQRVFLTEQSGIAGIAGEEVQKHRFNVPEDADKVVIVVNDVLRGNPDLYVSRNSAVTKETADCKPQAPKYGVEYCEYDSGGSFDVLIDTESDYRKTSFQAYYETSGSTNLLPYATIKSSEIKVVNTVVSFNGEGSYDNDGIIEGYFWQFGDNETSEAMTPEHVYSNEGQYTVTLTVTDDQGQTSSQSVVIEISAPPIGDWDLDGDIDANDIRQFMIALQRGLAIDERFDINEDGIINMRDAHALKALCTYYRCLPQPPAPQAPIANANGNYEVTVGGTLMLDSTGTYDINDDIAEYHWSFGDNSDSQDMNPSHIYAMAGVYDITLTVTDSLGQIGTSTSSVVVNPAPLNVIENACLNNDIFIDRKLTAGQAECLPTKSKISLTINHVDEHQSMAITLAHGSGNGDLIYRNGGWPKNELYDAISSNDGNSECIYIADIPADSRNYGYINVTGETEGASIVVDFDTAGCRLLP